MDFVLVGVTALVPVCVCVCVDVCVGVWVVVVVGVRDLVCDGDGD